jgi:hypothetical protein
MYGIRAFFTFIICRQASEREGSPVFIQSGIAQDSVYIHGQLVAEKFQGFTVFTGYKQVGILKYYTGIDHYFKHFISDETYQSYQKSGENSNAVLIVMKVVRHFSAPAFRSVILGTALFTVFIIKKISHNFQKVL